MDRYDLFRNLVVMALADGSVTEDELHMLSGRAIRWGVSDEQFEEAIEYAQSSDAHLTLPGLHGEKLEVLRELLRMMAVDGQLADIEKQLFAVAAATMKISDDELNALLDDMLQ